ncbi:DUF418 domain-containing protein [Metabacillus fastidiosus]|uniref:DUF418 domain-containing protein n=1 Tax=Metabacillus fastidiosus TaxID=1458 RepID=UPI002E21BECE|nr:DUF418 domain-containing protein [Metabacillus fastidiosus]
MGRLRLLDILRGFAILGTLGTNIWIFATLGDFSSFRSMTSNWWDSADTIIMTVFSFFTNGKFLSLLTILFGAGLELKRRKLERTKGLWPWLYIWSAALLFIDGLIHFIFVFEYDILMSYAVTALIVALLVNRKKIIIKWVVGICTAIHILGVSLGSVAFYFLLRDKEFITEYEQSVTDIANLYMHGSWFDQIQMRLLDFLMLRGEAIMVIPMNIILFFLGIMLVRSGIFAMDDEGRRKRKKLLQYGLLLGIPLNALIFVPGGMFDISVRYLFSPVLAIGYIGLFAILLEKRENSFLLARLEEVGKVALSCYILQNIVCSVLFYGWGFGLSNYFNGINTLMLWLFVCIVMFLFANVWLRFFKLGPFEYAWRALGNLPFRGNS